MTHAAHPLEPSVREWIDADDPDSRMCAPDEWERRRLERLHAVQVSLDVIAHAHNIPLRLMRLENLQNLDQTFVRFVHKWEAQIRSMFIERSPDESQRMPRTLGPEAADELIVAMKQPEHVATLRDWVLALADRNAPSLETLLKCPLPKNYAEWFLMLLPHLERDVWLTEMSNPLPVHNLARMVEHWSMFILMWAWSEADAFRTEIERFETHPEGLPTSVAVRPKALGIEHLSLAVLPAYQRSGRTDPERPKQVGLLAGPFVSTEAANSDDEGGWFYDAFHRFLSRVARVDGVEGWDEVHEKAPGKAELADALEARASIDVAEAQRRSGQSQQALQVLLRARLAPDLFIWPNGNCGRPLSRANWETMAILASWQARWGELLLKVQIEDSRPLWVSLPRHRVKLEVLRPMSPCERGEAVAQQLRFTASDQTTSADTASRWLSVDEGIGLARSAAEMRWVETPANLNARVRERQQAGWSSYISAINHLLARHTRRDRPEGADKPRSGEFGPSNCEEADHLLRGFGGRICRYLIGMARADLAEIYWLDYSSQTYGLRHAGSAERLIQHRSHRQSILTRSSEALAQALRGQPGSEASADGGFLVMRSVLRGQIVPLPSERKAEFAQKQSGPPGRTDFYNDSIPLRDAMAVPLTFNSRVVGIISLAGIASTRHFDTRLHPSLRLLAQDLGLAVYFQSQVWQMRQINWLASNVPLESWQRQDLQDADHPMNGVARCLANIFLCPGVHIWLKDRYNDDRYLLSASTASEAFAGEDAERQDTPPSVSLPELAQGQPVPMTRPTFGFALEPWLHLQDTSASGEEVQRLRGEFVQGRLDPSATDTEYTYRAARSGEMLLGQDFQRATDVANPNPDIEALSTLRHGLYANRKWTDVMSFALINEAAGQAKPIGVVSLHAPSINLEYAQKPWPPGWRPVVAHVQTYLPYVLTQTETVAKPLNQLVQYLLHQGRNELNAVSVRAANALDSLQAALAINDPPGKVRPKLRQLLKKANWGDRDHETRRQIEQLDHWLAEAATSLAALTSVEHAENLTLLSKLIERRRSVAALGYDLDTAGDVHRTRWIDLRDSIEKSLQEYKGDFSSHHIGISVLRSTPPWRLLTQRRLWSWLLSDLSHNIAKYTSAGTVVDVTIDQVLHEGRRIGHRLRFTNQGQYDPGTDKKEVLLAFGGRGSAGMRHDERKLSNRKLSRAGTGVGLWGVNELAITLGMGFDIDIRAQERNPGFAYYRFEITIPNELLRRDMGA